MNGASFETSSAISTDGLTLWFGSDRAGGAGANDIWVSQRATRASAWSTPVNVVALNSPADDIPRPPGQHALVMPMASTTVTATIRAGNYQTYLATRATTGAPFGAPVAIPELDYADRSTVDGFLTDDGLTMFFSSAPVAEAADAAVRPGRRRAGRATRGVPNSDLFVGWRRSTERGVLGHPAARRSQHRRRRARSVAVARRDDALLHLGPRRRAQHLHRARPAALSGAPRVSAPGRRPAAEDVRRRHQRRRLGVGDLRRARPAAC